MKRSIPIARRDIFDSSRPVSCHCISRCVRRAFLLEGVHRARWLQARIAFLTSQMALSVLEYASLSNHLHAVLATHPEVARAWTDREVATRYRTLCPDRVWRRRMKIDPALPAREEEIAAALAKPALLSLWRQRLSWDRHFGQALRSLLTVASTTRSSDGCDTPLHHAHRPAGGEPSTCDDTVTSGHGYRCSLYR